MYVVWHQTVSEDAHLGVGGLFAKEIEVDEVIGTSPEDRHGGAEAGAKFCTSAVGLAELERHFRGAWPRKYQVVVRTESVDSYTLQTHFEFVRVLE